jgi:neurabin
MGMTISKDREIFKKKIKELKMALEKEKKQQEKERKIKEKEQKKQRDMLHLGNQSTDTFFTLISIIGSIKPM